MSDEPVVVKGPRKAHFRVVGRLNQASKIVEGTLIIDRGAGLVDVRPLRSRKRYTRTLSDVATWVCQSVIKREIFEKRLAKAARRKGKRR